MVVIFELEFAVRSGPTPEAEVTLGDKDQVSFEDTLGIDLAVADDGSLEPKVGAELAHLPDLFEDCIALL